MKSKKMMVAILASAVGVASFAANAEEQVTKTFRTVKDTFITQEKEGKPGDRSHRNYGKSKFLAIDTQYSGKKANILLGFDLSSIPKEAKITSAVLIMGSKIKPSVGALKSIEIRRLLRDDWVEGTEGDKTHKPKTACSWIARAYSGDVVLKWDKPGALGTKDSDAEDALFLDKQQDIKELNLNGFDIAYIVDIWSKKRDVKFGLLIRTTNDKINLWRCESADAGDETGASLIVTYTLP